MTATKTLAIVELEGLVARAFERSNVSATNALSVARALVLAQIDGQHGHGLVRVASYAAQARIGKVDGHAMPTAEATRPGALFIDAHSGFAYPALDLALERLPAMARSAGIAAAGITRSHHFGVAGHAVERLAAAGLIGLIAGNTPKAMAAAGGTRALLGTNPIAFAAPRGAQPPIVIDMALSEVARSRIVAAAEAGKPIPLGWAVDSDGRPTTNAKAALAGTLLPIGGAKGAALALMVETLAVALTGARFGFEASSFLDDKGSPPGVGQFLLAIDPAAFAGADQFAARMAALAAQIEDGSGARLPGQQRFALRQIAARAGVIVEEKLLARIRVLAGA